jgi:hypothetical protein
MANKMFYTKPIGDLELCLVCGYVGENKCYIFYRKKGEYDSIKEIGTFDENTAFKIFKETNL